MEYDSPTSLYHTYARYYSPGLQRFLSEDPLQFGGGDVSLFAYARNDPVNHSDRQSSACSSGAHASYPVFVRLAPLLHASFGPNLAIVALVLRYPSLSIT